MARLWATALAVLGLLGLSTVGARPVEQHPGLHVDPDGLVTFSHSLDGYTLQAQADFVPTLPGAPPNKLKIFAG